MKVSIITATFNSSRYISDCIESVNGQTYPHIEHVFIDGGSSDSTLDIVKGNSTRENVIITEKDEGIYDAINKGIQIASGDIIGLVHSDDLLASPTIIADIVACFNNGDYDAVYGDLNYVKPKNPNKIVRYWKSSKFYYRLLNTGWMPPHPTLYTKKDIFKKYGYYNLQFRIAADYEFVLRVFSKRNLKVAYLPKVICKMRIGGASNKSLRNIMQKSREDLRALRLNGMRTPVFTLLMKNISKVPQFMIK